MFENRGNIIDEWGKIMKIENIMKMLEVFWPIAIAIYGFFIYKFIPYMKTKSEDLHRLLMWNAEMEISH